MKMHTISTLLMLLVVSGTGALPLHKTGPSQATAAANHNASLSQKADVFAPGSGISLGEDSVKSETGIARIWDQEKRIPFPPSWNQEAPTSSDAALFWDREATKNEPSPPSWKRDNSGINADPPSWSRKSLESDEHSPSWKLESPSSETLTPSLKRGASESGSHAATPSWESNGKDASPPDWTHGQAAAPDPPSWKREPVKHEASPLLGEHDTGSLTAPSASPPVWKRKQDGPPAPASAEFEASPPSWKRDASDSRSHADPPSWKREKSASPPSWKRVPGPPSWGGEPSVTESKE